MQLKPLIFLLMNIFIIVDLSATDTYKESYYKIKQTNSNNEEVFIKSYTYNASDDDSKNSSRKKAILQLKSLLSEEVGTYIRSNLEMKEINDNNNATRKVIQEISSISASFTKLHILDEKWNGKTYYIKASILIDKKLTAELILKAIEDKKIKTELEKLKSRLILQEEKYNAQLKKITTATSIDYSSKLNLRSAEDIVFTILEKDVSKISKEFSTENGQSSNSKTFKHRILQIEEYHADGENNILIVTYSKPQKWECHACSTLLSFFIFEIKDEVWRKTLLLKESYIGATFSGEWGQADGINILKIGDNRIAYARESHSATMGYGTGRYRIEYIINGELKNIFDITTELNDSGAKETTQNSWKSKITFLNTGLSFYDIQIVQNGLKDGKIFYKKIVYTFNGLKYIVKNK